MAIPIEGKYLFQRNYRRIMKARSLTNKQIAEILGIRHETACRFSNLTTHGRIPNIFQLKEISEVTGIPIELFFQF